MKARFLTEPNPVTLVTDGNTVYCQIALNPTEVMVIDPETEETHTEWECDYNDWHCSKRQIDVDDVQAHPEDYLDYKPVDVPETEQRLRDIEDAIAELGEIIGG